MVKVWSLDGSVWRSRHRAPVAGEPITTRTGPGAYEIELPDVHYSVHHDSPVCTMEGTSPASITTGSDTSGNLTVETFAQDAPPTNMSFACAIYL